MTEPYLIKRAKEMAPEGEPWLPYLRWAYEETVLYYGHPFPYTDPREIAAQEREQKRIEQIERTHHINHNALVQ